MNNITVNGFEFSTSASGRVIVSGGGITGRGIDLGPIDSFTADSFARNISGVPAAAAVQEQLLSTAASDTGVILAALQNKPVTETQPVTTPATPASTEITPATESGLNETEAQNEEYIANRGADDDNTSSAAAQTATAADTATSSSSSYFDPKTGAGEFGVDTSNKSSTTISAPSGDDSTIPGRRVYNPLSKLSSYTYQITWYMVNPDAINSLIDSQFRSINTLLPSEGGGAPQAYIIAQSGGVGDPQLRAPGMIYDYYIDELQFKTVLQVQGGPASGLSFQWKVIEPNSFSLPTKIVLASNTMYQNSSILKGITAKDRPNPLDQHFVLGVRFYGYDENGKVIDSKTFGSQNISVSDPSAVFERFYSIKITEFKFRLDGRATVYDIKAAPLAMNEAYGTKRGQITSPVTVSGTTVQQVLTGPNGLITRLNSLQTNLLNNNTIQYPDRYSVKFEAGNQIESSTITNATNDKTNTTTSTARTTVQSNPQQASRTVAVSPEVNLAINTGTILSAIDKIIAQSDYVLSAINQVNKPDSYVEESDTETKAASKELSWYHVNPLVKPYRWDPRRNDWAYDIIYQVHEHKIPYLRSPYVPKTSIYPGPHKIYDYWYTGQNSEIVSYEQNFSGLYYLLFANITGTNQSSTDRVGSVPIAASGGPQAAVDSSGGGVTGTQTAQIRNDLYSPKDQVIFKAQILGDPDYLTQSMGTDTLTQNFYKRFSVYSYDGFTINANGGQVFIEIGFNEPIDWGATVDPGTTTVSYSKENGLLGLSDSIRFYNPKTNTSEAADSPRIVYMLSSVVSNFSRGRFTQELTGILIDPGSFFKNNRTSSGTGSAAGTQSQRESTTQANTAAGSPGPTNNNLNQRAGGLLPAPTAAVGAGVDFAPPPPTTAADTNTNDDDNTPTATRYQRQGNGD